MVRLIYVGATFIYWLEKLCLRKMGYAQVNGSQQKKSKETNIFSLAMSIKQHLLCQSNETPDEFMERSAFVLQYKLLFFRTLDYA